MYLQKSRIDPWIYSFLLELVSFELNRDDAIKDSANLKPSEPTPLNPNLSASASPPSVCKPQIPGVLRQVLSCLQYLVQHISDCPELFRVYSSLLEKANKPVEAFYQRLREFRTLQAKRKP